MLSLYAMTPLTPPPLVVGNLRLMIENLQKVQLEMPGLICFQAPADKIYSMAC